MPRPLRIDDPELFYHVTNRGNGRMRLFHKDGDFAAFERVLAEGPLDGPSVEGGKAVVTSF